MATEFELGVDAILEGPRRVRSHAASASRVSVEPTSASTSPRHKASALLSETAPGNGPGERFDEAWNAFGKANIDFYGKAGPNNETGGACLVEALA
jgi:hypothetical protein